MLDSLVAWFDKIGRGKIWLISIICIIAAMIAITSTLLLGGNNPIEQVAEKVIENEIGVKVDFAPLADKLETLSPK